MASVGFYYFFSDAGHEIAKALGRKRQEDVSLLTEQDLLSNNKRSEAEKEGRQKMMDKSNCYLGQFYIMFSLFFVFHQCVFCHYFLIFNPPPKLI